jgi:hypothetical protein
MATTKFHLSIACDNAAFEDDVKPELASILRAIAARIGEGGDFNEPVKIYDSNGNVVGSYVLE